MNNLQHILLQDKTSNKTLKINIFIIKILLYLLILWMHIMFTELCLI